MKKENLVSIVSFLVTTILHSLVMGTVQGIVFTLVLLVHELGHVFALKYEKLPASTPMFIPFAGAYVTTTAEMDRETGAFVAIMGPFLGTIASIIAAVPFFITHDTVWLKAAEIGVMFNVVNLIPLRPFDGGTIIGSRKGLNVVSGVALLPFLTLTFMSGAKVSTALFCVIGFYFWAFTNIKKRTAEELRKQRYLELIQERISYSYLVCWVAVAANGLIAVYALKYIRESN